MSSRTRLIKSENPALGGVLFGWVLAGGREHQPGGLCQHSMVMLGALRSGSIWWEAGLVVWPWIRS